MANLQKIEVSIDGERATLLIHENTARKLTQDKNYLRQYVAALKNIGVLKSDLATDAGSDKSLSQQSPIATTVISGTKDVVAENSQRSRNSVLTDNVVSGDKAITMAENSQSSSSGLTDNVVSGNEDIAIAEKSQSSKNSELTNNLVSGNEDIAIAEKSQSSKSSELKNNSSEWNRSATVFLITTRIEMESDFQKPIQKLKLWNKISRTMKEHGYNFGSGECHAKWRNLMVTYRKNVDKSKQCGASSIRWEHYNILHEAYGNKTNTSDLYLRSSLQNYTPTYESPLLQQKITPEETSFQTLLHKRRRTSEEPPAWFQKYLQKMEEEEKRKAEKEEQRWQQLKEFENKKIEAMKELTDVLKKFLEK